MKKKLLKIIMLFAVMASLLTLVSCLKSDDTDFTKIKVMMLETDGVELLSKQVLEIRPGSDVSFNIKVSDEYAYLGMTKNGVTVREEPEAGKNEVESPIEGEYDEKNGVLKLKGIKYPTTVEVIAEPKSELYSFAIMYNDSCGRAEITGGTKITKGYKWMPQQDGKVSLIAYPYSNYNFNGWSIGDYIENGGQVVSYDEEFEFTVQENTVLYANFSDVPANQYKIVYHMNGGKVANDGKSSYEISKEWNSQFSMQQTLISNGTFVRDGYVAIGYSTHPANFESYESVNKIPGFSNMGGVCQVSKESKTLGLYVVWAKETTASDFTFSGGTITKYNGNAGIVVIPEKINGVAVKTISAGAFKDNKTLNRLVIPRTVETISDGAFENCTELKEVVFFDSLLNVTDNSFKNCNKISVITLNAQRLPKYSGTAEGTFCIKYERVRTLTGKKIIVVAGSSTMHGLDSIKMEYLFPGYSVVNYGTNSSVSMLFYLDVIANYIDDGDIIIHAPEVEFATTMGSNQFSAKLFRANEQCYDIFREVDMTKYPGFWTAFGKFQNGDSSQNLSAAKNLPGREQQLPCMDLNIYGDWNISKPSEEKPSFGGAVIKFNTSLINHVNLNAVNEKITAAGGTLLMSFAPRDIERINPLYATAAEFDKYTKYCETVLDYPVISNIGSYLLDHNYFFDSEYNCNDEGVRVRTELLASDLKNYMSNPSTGAPVFSDQYKIIYYANGGIVSTNGSSMYEVTKTRDEQFSMQQTIWSNGTFTRNGYVAVGYSTSPVSFEDRGFSTVNDIPGFSNMGGVCEVPQNLGKLSLYVVWAKETASTNFEFSNGTITKYNGNAEIVVIPEKINGKAVTRIAAGAFRDKSTLKRLVIPKTVVTIDDLAFENCTNLKEVVFFDSVLNVTNDSFKNCNKISTITINSQRLPKYSGGAEGSFCIKYERVRTLKTKKIVVVSGSSTMHSLESEIMEQNFPGYSVVNYGTNVSNSSLFFLDVISNYIKEGDIIIHAPEMSSTVMGDNGIRPKLFRANEQCYDIFREVDMTKYTDFWSAWGKFQVGDPNDSSLTPAISLAGREYQLHCSDLNMYGDWNKVKSGPRQESFGSASQRLNKGNLSSANAERLNWVNEKITSKGGTLLMTFATVDISIMNPSEITDELCNYYTSYCETMLDYAVISNVKTYMFEHEYFYDSQWHANDAGSVLRTDLLTEDLRRYLANPGPDYPAPML